ncbi:RDD family protein, partial [Zhihengliuella halotolerans]|uniref:RDD family protein n=1 Tax=Zhihengliuella halotolerans TaxID=370736 RepID=UPI0011AFA8F9
MAKVMNLVNASAGKRLAAWLLDMVPLAILGAVFGAVLGPRLVQAATAPEILSQIAGTYALFGLIALGYTVFLWWWEATQGKTLGNLVLKLRTSNEDGFAPGWGRVIVRRLLIGVAGVVPVIGPVLMVVSNLWDANHQRQGWHDKVARTLVMDVGVGRDPLTTGGLFGPEAFAPTHLPAAPVAQATQHESDAAFTGVINAVPGQPEAPQLAPSAPARTEQAPPAPAEPPRPAASEPPAAPVASAAAADPA